MKRELQKLLEVKDLKTQFNTLDGIVSAVDGVSFSINPGETLGIAGESGCGKSVTSLSIMKLVPEPPGMYVGGSIRFEGQSLLDLPETEMRKIRGNDIAMVFQEPMSSLNPLYKIGDQIGEAIRLHQGLKFSKALEKAIHILELVGVPNPEVRVREYPHQLSGGMRQRVMIAIALSCNPKLLIADEPTTALDVTIQAQILELMKRLKQDIGMAIMLITHDLGVLAEMVERVVIMYAGKIVEEADVKMLFSNPLHPYTCALLNCTPRIDCQKGRLNTIEGLVPDPLDFPLGCRFHPRCSKAQTLCRNQEPQLLSIGDRRVACHLANSASCINLAESEINLENMDDRQTQKNNVAEGQYLEVLDLKKYFPMSSGVFKSKQSFNHAVDGVSLSVRRRETFGLVGESGCGKTTISRTILRLIPATSGRVYFKGEDIFNLSRRNMSRLRSKMQIIFQDPYASLDPRMKVARIIAEPFVLHNVKPKTGIDSKIKELLQVVGLQPSDVRRYPFQFSGGQRQRICIARALTLNPELIICDEPVSALDVSIQSQILNLLDNLKKQFGLTLVFISHDLNVIKHISDRVGVMYLGKMVELAPTTDLFITPYHPYTKALISAIPIRNPKIEKKRVILEGDVPNSIKLPTGCRFHTRCPEVMERCRHEEPKFHNLGNGRFVYCHRFEDISIKLKP